MNKLFLSFSFVSLLFVVPASADQGGYVDAVLTAIGIPATEFSADEEALLKVVRDNDTKDKVVAALIKQYGKDHEWPLQIARYKLSELVNHLTKLNDTDTYTNDIELVKKALEFIEIGTVPFN